MVASVCLILKKKVPILKLQLLVSIGIKLAVSRKGHAENISIIALSL